ncbi:MAG TPA: glycoside hydrolase family 2 TIM barrel-domain containing protein, partial [Gemmatimonadaceae bacterium]|nr:glycoside hydrolase family 2 TIM barrel-domain containing protein [Gemmatimonadaceae bacterium]
VLAALLATTPASAQRQRWSLDPAWRFLAGDTPGAQAPAFDDAGWRTVDVPHDWSVEGPYAQTNAASGRGGFLPVGVGWYRKRFTLPRGASGRRAWLELDGVYMNADVWVNGTKVGHRPYGYASQWYDVTPQVVPGVNVIAVRVDNSRQINSRYYSGSGITRHSWLTLTDPLHIGHWGSYVTTPVVDSASARVVVRTRVENDGTGAREGTLRSVVMDPDGREVARAETALRADAGAKDELEQQLAVPAPRRWGPESPAMYTLLQTVDAGGRTVDEVATPFGIRTILFDKDSGFALNGRRLKLNGVNLHHDGGAVGAAVPERVWARRFAILKEMGVNAIRTAHNPFTPEFLDLADQMGFLVMNEAFDEWKAGKVPQGYHVYFDEWADRDLAEFVQRDRNHPSVVLWSAGNEIPEQVQPEGHLVLKRLQDIIHREDPSRPVTTGNDRIRAGNGPAKLEFLETLDIVGYNYVDRWNERRERYATDDRHAHPDWKMVGTESSSLSGTRNGYSLGPDSSVPRADYTARMMRPEQLWKFVSLNDYYAGDFMWTGIDYLGESQWPSKGAGSGPIDMAGFPKDAFYFYQSQWTSRPVLHLFPHWNWPRREGQTIPVIAYTNCQAVELFLNGRSLGEKRLEFPRQGNDKQWNQYARPVVNPTTTDLHLSWDVPYAPGVLRAVGKREGSACATAEVRTAGAAATLRLTVDRDTIDAVASDVAHVKVEILDENGILVPDAGTPVRFTVDGGRLVATDNGDLRDLTPFASAERRAFHGMVLAIVRADRPGRLRVSASADGLRGATIDIVARRGTPPPALR